VSCDTGLFLMNSRMSRDQRKNIMVNSPGLLSAVVFLEFELPDGVFVDFPVDVNIESNRTVGNSDPDRASVSGLERRYDFLLNRITCTG